MIYDLLVVLLNEVDASSIPTTDNVIEWEKGTSTKLSLGMARAFLVSWIPYNICMLW